MISERPVTITLLSAGAGLLLAVFYSASPLTMWVAAAAVAACRVAGRGLPAPERRLLVAVLGVALVTRLVFVAARFVTDIPYHSDLSVGALSGDEAYYLSRALRVRDIALGMAHTTYDYFVATDDYGRTSYLTLLTGIQVVFGPTPYSMRLLNGLLFVAGAAILFRTVRPAFGALPAFTGLVAVLFLPSLFVASVSLLKESVYFLVAAALFAACVRVARARRIPEAVVALVVAAACVYALNDLRRGAAVLATLGIGAGLGMRAIDARWWRVTAAAAVLLVVGAVALSQPSVRARALNGVASAARAHAGHVFTVGHSYKLLDDEFYMNPQEPSSWDLGLTEPQAARFLLRAAVSFVVTPLPWEMRSLSERLFLPEHLVWYVSLVLLIPGARAGWKRDPLLTSLLLGYALPLAAALAVTNGNVGTLLRLRGLVTPYLIWVSAIGLCAVGDALAGRAAATPGSHHHAESPAI